MLIVLALVPTPASGDNDVASAAPRYDLRVPIHIQGDSAFRTENGVRGGNGSADDPYRIEGWEIAWPHGTQAAINVVDTDAFFEIRDVYIHAPGSIGIYLSNVANGRITRVTAAENSFGISAWRSHQLAIVGNNLSGNFNGLLVAHSTDTIVSGNVVSDNLGQGIQVVGSRNVTVSENVASNNGDMGITSLDSDLLRITGNLVSFSVHDAIGLRVPFRPTMVGNISVVGNTIIDNDWGIFASSATYTTMVDNFLERNRVGISLGRYGLVMHNTVIDSEIHAVSPVGIASGMWNGSYPEGGNYWSDYAGVDRCTGPAQDACEASDGIGDTPYPVDGGPEDRYPLMGPTNAPPIAMFTISPSAGDVTTDFVADASASTDGLGEDLLVRWDWEGDGLWDTDWAEARSGRHVYDRPGTYPVRVDVKDPAGLRSIVTGSVAVSADVTKPVVSIASPSDGAVLSSTEAEIAGTAADNSGIETVELSVDGENWTLANGTVTWSGRVILVEGSNTIHVRVLDAVGNEALMTVNVTVEIADAPFTLAGIPLSIVVAATLVAVSAVLVAYWLRRKQKT